MPDSLDRWAIPALAVPMIKAGFRPNGTRIVFCALPYPLEYDILSSNARKV